MEQCNTCLYRRFCKLKDLVKAWSELSCSRYKHVSCESVESKSGELGQWCDDTNTTTYMETIAKRVAQTVFREEIKKVKVYTVGPGAPRARIEYYET